MQIRHIAEKHAVVWFWLAVAGSVPYVAFIGLVIYAVLSTLIGGCGCVG